MSRGAWFTLKGKSFYYFFNSVFTNLLFFRTLRRKLSKLGLQDCVDKNPIVQNWYHKIWALQLVPPADVPSVFEKFIKTSVPYEEEEEEDYTDDMVEGYDEALSQYVSYVEANWIGTPRGDAPRKKPRFAISTWSINESVLEDTEFCTNSSESWNSVTKLSVVAKPSLWQLIIQLKAEDSSARAKVMSIRSGTWKDRNPGRSKKREEKRNAMRNLVLDYYTMSTDVFLEAAITFFNVF